jgi:hypothetical protein
MGRRARAVTPLTNHTASDVGERGPFALSSNGFTALRAWGGRPCLPPNELLLAEPCRPSKNNLGNNLSPLVLCGKRQETFTLRRETVVMGTGAGGMCVRGSLPAPGGPTPVPHNPRDKNCNQLYFYCCRRPA